MQHLHQLAEARQLTVAQVLLNRSDFDDRRRSFNLRNCLLSLETLGAVPVLNENDSVATEEIRFGDNDMLAALAAAAMDADALLLLTSAAGLLDDNNQVVPMVSDLSAARAWVRDEQTHWGTGGFTSKLDAAELATQSGTPVVIARGARHQRDSQYLPRSGRGHADPRQR